MMNPETREKINLYRWLDKKEIKEMEELKDVKQSITDLYEKHEKIIEDVSIMKQNFAKYDVIISNITEVIKELKNKPNENKKFWLPFGIAFIGLLASITFSILSFIK